MQGCWCGSGCGERYWGDFYSDSPDCCDPCDGCGNYAGCGSGVSGGCRSCGDGYGGAPTYDDNVVYQSKRVAGPIPKTAAKPHKAVRP